MDKAEQLMLTFTDINYVFDNRMPSGQKGLYIDNSIYLNPRQSSYELTSTVAEEIAHHYTSVGDITNYELTEARKQERKARLVAAEITVHPTQLINAYENGCREYWEVADELGITVEALKEGIELFKEKYGEGFIYGEFKIVFGSGDSMKVVKIK
ncbi:ImmA/IrrE family metallo-endopeptidase [Enterococcus avium]|uniref:ImmA/IrrE family metallo-endopeptidase n=1 Tax=Enterococcus avium TaxID=33945 RepID=UPI003392E1C4